MSSANSELSLAIVTADSPRILLVDDDDSILSVLQGVFEREGFAVTTASNVNEALAIVGSQTFDVLLSDLQMPRPGDGLTVVSAMRHANPKAVTLIFSGYPEMNKATAAILLQADDVLVKPMKAELLVATIRNRLEMGTKPEIPVLSVAQILERETQSTIEDWLQEVRRQPEVVAIPLDDHDRCAHLPQLFRDLVFRLRNPLPLGSRALVSAAASLHGILRSRQGYTAAMLVEESRMLQVSIFQTLQDNLAQINFSLLLVGVMAIADEVDSQLAQQMASYLVESTAYLSARSA
jgi:CheY-like chemotaxis protein